MNGDFEMIEITRKDTKVILKVDVYPIGYVFNFTYDAGSEWAAVALHKILGETFRERVQAIRRDEYKEGLKDARKRKALRKDYFSARLIK